MRQGNKIWTWVGVFMLVVLIVAGCTAAPGTGGAAPVAETAAPAAGGGNGDVVEGWGGGYKVVLPDLCPPVEDDNEVDTRVQQPIYFQQKLGTGSWNDKEVLTRLGLSANEQGEIFGLQVAGADSNSTEEAILAYSNALRICFDQIFAAGISGEMAGDTVEVPATDADAQAGSDEETPDPKQVAAESLVIQFWSIGFVTGGDVPGDKLGDILKEIVNGDVAGWESALSDPVKQKLDLQFISTAEKSKTSPDSVFDFIIDPPINNGVRHQYVGYGQKSVSTTVSVGGGSGAGKAKAGLCRDSTPSPFMSRTVDRNGTQSAWLSGTSTSSKIYDLGVIGKKNASKYRMTGRWYRNYTDPAPSGSLTDCNPS